MLATTLRKSVREKFVSNKVYRATKTLTLLYNFVANIDGGKIEMGGYEALGELISSQAKPSFKIWRRFQIRVNLYTQKFIV